MVVSRAVKLTVLTTSIVVIFFAENFERQNLLTCFWQKMAAYFSIWPVKINLQHH